MSAKPAEQLHLEVGGWYAWQMFPGYSASPYRSPIRVAHVEPRKTGQGILRLGFYNAAYASGVRDFSKDLRVLKHTDRFILADFPNEPDHAAAIHVLTLAWLQEAFADWCTSQHINPIRPLGEQLDRAFRIQATPR